MKKYSGPKVLVFDVETSPLHVEVWGLGQNYVSLDQLIEDSRIISWSAKWLNDPVSKIMNMNLRSGMTDKGETKILKGLLKLINQSDIVLTQNGKRFDEKRVNGRIEYYDLGVPNKHKHIDTCQIVKQKFGLTSNKLEYLAEKFNKKYKKLKHKKYPGRSLWRECKNGNQDAWNEMIKYNNHDVLALEELYVDTLQKWDSTNFNIYYNDGLDHCSCGSTEFKENGHDYQSTGVFKRYKCKKCGAPYKSTKSEYKTSFVRLK